MIITLSIITINYNGYKDTCALLDTLPAEDDIEIIVVDNDSSKDEATQIEERYPHVTLIRSKENLGFAGGNNLGIKAAKGKFLFFINNDTGVPAGQWSNIRKLIGRLEVEENIGAVCPKIRFFWGNHPIQFAGYTPLSRITMRNRSIGFGETDNGQYDTPHPTPYAHGAAMIVKRAAIEKAGLMPECFFLYYEELDWSMMMRRAGFDIWYDPALTILHKESQSTGQESPLRTYYITRNRLLYARRNLKPTERLATYCYLIGLVLPRDLLRHLFSNRFGHFRSTLLAVSDFLRRRTGQQTMF